MGSRNYGKLDDIIEKQKDFKDSEDGGRTLPLKSLSVGKLQAGPVRAAETQRRRQMLQAIVRLKSHS